MPENLIAYDTETTGLELHSGHQMFAFSTCDVQGRTQVHRLDGNLVRATKGRQALERLIASKASLIMHNAKFDLTATEKYLQKHITDGRRFHDTYLQAHLFMNLHPTRGLKELAWELAGIPNEDERAVKRAAGGRGYHTVPEEIMDRYQHLDALRAMTLHRFFYPKIKRDKNLIDAYEAELALVPVTMRMEERGFMLNRFKCQCLIERLDREAQRAVDDIAALIGRRVNPDSNKQIKRLLYDELELPVLKLSKGGGPSVNKESLSLLEQVSDNPVFDLVLKARSYRDGVSTLKGYLKHADVDGLLHPDINTCAAKTGRESCSRPNLQNVAKTGVLLNRYPIPAREVFMPRPGHVLIFTDYAGIEMRLLIHYSREPELIDLLNENGNPHDVAAQIFFGDRYRNADPQTKKTLYSASKNANFAIPYGAGADKMAGTLGLPPEEGAARYKEYKKRFPKLVSLGYRIASEVRANGYVTTVFGNRLHVPRNKAYIGTNYLIQGTAAGILKRAQVRLNEYLDKNVSDIHLLLPIHDEVVQECPRQRLRDLREILQEQRKLLIDFPQFSVPLDVESQLGTYDWEHKEKFSLGA